METNEVIDELNEILDSNQARVDDWIRYQAELDYFRAYISEVRTQRGIWEDMMATRVEELFASKQPKAK